jgi:organic radical activating enzyme
MNKTFCARPWTAVGITTDGFHRMCCHMTSRTNIHISEASIKEVWESDYYTDIRKAMLNGEVVDACKKCYLQEAAGVLSQRQKINKKYIVDVNAPKIKYVDLRLGNLCNLKCRMCDPGNSTQWYKDFEKLNGYKSEFENKMGWVEEDNIWSSVYELKDDIEEIYFTGGEPTLIERHFDILQNLIDLGLSKNIKLKYNTNMTNIQQRTIDIWKKFKRVFLNCSIDGYKDLNTYIRYPSNWNILESNILKSRKLLPNIYIFINCTVQIGNVFHLNKLEEWCNANQLELGWNILEYPHYNNIKALPAKLKQQITSGPSEIIAYMNSEDLSKNFNKYIDYTKKLDVIRNNNLLITNPEFAEYY